MIGPAKKRADVLTRSPQAGRRPALGSILNRDPTLDLWRKVGIPKSRDIRKLRPASLPPKKRFETPHDVAVRKRKLVMSLQDLEPDLADAYDSCAPDAWCSIPGCPACSRLHRGYLYSETARINESALAGPRFFVTVFLKTIPFGELTRVRIQDEHNKFKKRLERSGIRGLLIGGTEVNWDYESRAWILHLHILSVGVSADAWDRLRANLGDTGSAIPIKREDLEDPVDPLSYKQKWVTYFRPRRRVGYKPSDGVPLKPPQIAELCRWWSCHRFEDFLFLFGARRRGGRIVPEVRPEKIGPVEMVGGPRLLFSRTVTFESIYRGRTTRVTVRDELAIDDQIPKLRHSAKPSNQGPLPTVPTKPTKHTGARTP